MKIDPETPELEPMPATIENAGTTAAVSPPPLPAETLKTVLDVVASTLEPARFPAGATALVTALAARLACDRVSVGMLKYGRLHVRALSHSAQFNQKTDLLQAIASAMEEALDQQDTILLPSQPRMPARVTRAHEELSRRYGATALCSIPLWAQGRIVGVLMFERGGGVFDSHALALCEAIGGVAGPILDLKHRDDRWLAAKAVEAGRDQLGRVIGRGHLALKLGVVLLIALAAFLATATGDFRVTAKAVLEGEVQLAAVAPFQGYLETAPARAGDLVHAGQVLATLQDRDLKLERLKFLSQQAELSKEHRQALAEHDAPKVQIITAQLGQVEAQLALATEKLSRTRVVSPIPGVVVTGDLSQKLGSPVEQGQLLFEVAPLDTYRIVLQVDERDISYIRIAQSGQIMLSSLPHEPFAFSVTKITPVSTAQEGRNFFRIEGRFAATPTQLRPAMEGVGKIDIDRRRLIWIWTHDAVNWLRLKLWTWLP